MFYRYFWWRNFLFESICLLSLLHRCHIFWGKTVLCVTGLGMMITTELMMCLARSQPNDGWGQREKKRRGLSSLTVLYVCVYLGGPVVILHASGTGRLKRLNPRLTAAKREDPSSLRGGFFPGFRFTWVLVLLRELALSIHSLLFAP